MNSLKACGRELGWPKSEGVGRGAGRQCPLVIRPDASNGPMCFPPPGAGCGDLHHVRQLPGPSRLGFSPPGELQEELRSMKALWPPRQSWKSKLNPFFYLLFTLTLLCSHSQLSTAGSLLWTPRTGLSGAWLMSTLGILGYRSSGPPVRQGGTGGDTDV